RQRCAEAEHAIVFHLVAHFAPAGMIAVLLAPPRVATGGLDVAVLARANPHASPGGRNRQRPNPPERIEVAHGLAIGGAIDKSLALFLAGDAGTLIRYINQARAFSRFGGRHRRYIGSELLHAPKNRALGRTRTQ